MQEVPGVQEITNQHFLSLFIFFSTLMLMIMMNTGNQYLSDAGNQHSIDIPKFRDQNHFSADFVRCTSLTFFIMNH